MLPSKVIPISEARRRVAVKVRAKTRKARVGVWVRAKAWLSSRATNGTTLLVGVLAGLALGALLASLARTAP